MSSNPIGSQPTSPPGLGNDAGGPPSGSPASGFMGSSQTTAVAMVILYSITGIITALFLGIIVTGAIRAHRHPERYGPRNVVGRPRQSRAKGLARAMLDTIPIVKFGDPREKRMDAMKGDVELSPGMEREEVDVESGGAIDTGAEHSPEARPSQEDNNGNSESQLSPPTPGAELSPKTPDDDDSSNNVCPICTEDFIKGQDVRVLPCNHQFHPACIDPWLINVSGTCPLCRIDLNPAAASAENRSREGVDSSEWQPAERYDMASELDPVPAYELQGVTSRPEANTSMAQLHTATVEERIATLRRLRQENRQYSLDETGDDIQNRRRSLAARFRERFRIRTRQHGTEFQSSLSSPGSGAVS